MKRPYDAAWNAAIRAAMNEYHAHPTAACANAYCDQLADRGSYCKHHRPKRAGEEKK